MSFYQFQQTLFWVQRGLFVGVGFVLLTHRWSGMPTMARLLLAVLGVATVLGLWYVASFFIWTRLLGNPA